MTKCTECGQPAKGMLTMFNISKMESKTICGRCRAKKSALRFTKLKKLDKEIAEYEKLAGMYEGLISRNPEMPVVPEAIQGFAMTPLTIYSEIQDFLAAYKSRRMELITQEGSETRLKYELKQSIEKEDYERSAVIRDKLESKKKMKKSKKSVEGDPSV
jgi:protein-arginine kinase activator protein McsA